MIWTVTGPIEVAELGRTLCHEHLAIDLSAVRGDDDSTFTDSAQVRAELALAREGGIDSIIEVTCEGMGRDPAAMVALSNSSGIRIVCSTGFYLECYHPAWVRAASIEQIEDYLLHDFVAGIGDTGVRPGVIGEIAGERDEITASERRVMRASARAAVRIGCAVTTHCQLGAMALEQADVLLSEGIDPHKVVLGHLDLADDVSYLKRVLELGVNIGFDTCGKTAYLEDERRVDDLRELIEAGCAGQIMLSNDVSRKSYFTANGKAGYTAVTERIVPALLGSGDYRSAVDTMLIANPARTFSIKGGFE